MKSFLTSVVLTLMCFPLLTPLALAATPPTCTLVATPGSITQGSTFTLKWTTTGATSGIITDLGDVAPQGSVRILPPNIPTLTYIGIFTGQGGKVTCRTTVTQNTGTGAGSSTYVPTTYGPASPYTQATPADPTQYAQPTNYKTTTYTTGTKYQPTQFQSTFPVAGTASGGGTTDPSTPAPSINSPGAKDTGGLVPCGNSDNYITATECNLCDVGILLQRFINFLLIVSIPIAVGMFAWAGIMYFTSAANPKRIAQVHKVFKSIFIGFVIVLTGYLIVGAIIKTVAGESIISSWNTLSCADANHAPKNAEYDPSNPDARPRNSTLGKLIEALFSTSATPVIQNAPAGDISLPDLQNGIVRAQQYTSVFQEACPSGSSNASCVAALQAICTVESGCGQNVGSNSGCNTAAGACGPMQMLPQTACAVTNLQGCSLDGKVTNLVAVQRELQDMSTAAEVAAKYYTQLLNGVCSGNTSCAFAAYNGGPGAVAPSANCPGSARWQCPYDSNSARTGQPCNGTTITDCTPNIGYKQTRSYVQATLMIQSR